MPFYRYDIKHTNGDATGTIEAVSEQAARDQLTEQYVPEKHGFVDENGQPKEHKLVSLDLEEIE